MRKLTAFNFVTLNGFYKDENNSTSWHIHGEEGAKFSEENMQAGNTLLFGRITYQMMAGFWPSRMAMQSMPGVAKGMNDAQKIVISSTLQTADWNNTTLIKGNLIDEIKKLKEQPGNDITILGSGSISAQLANAGLLDGFMLWVDPIAITGGTPMFEGITRQLNFKLTNCRTLKNGAAVLSYEL
ncbi:dihydrofolate reductase family protein [Mucilaginibacter flavus]|uniref:dihydrofolate reductase family protein n=1 Tax=Mucilaginibacter flavus TaxID=931504 RepID=UPI0025B55F49|nr:dihydrofolate reductase family protein [Mucilaginibacter flavus]MDN3582647.1 dihydrofolate reductase family protein [Mucilaginibacter flavus]